MMRRTTEHRDDTVVHDDGAAHAEPHADRLLQDDAVVEPVYDDAVVERRSGRYYGSLPSRINGILFAVLAAIESLLALRFLLLAFGANRTSGFVDFILDVSWPLVRPFDGAFNNRTWDEGIIEPATLLAMGVWLLGFLLVAMLVSAIVPRLTEDETEVRRRRVTHN